MDLAEMSTQAKHVKRAHSVIHSIFRSLKIDIF